MKTTLAKYPEPLRPSIMCTNGAVSSGHHLASMAGLKILMKGGNAFDSAIATSAVLCVTRPQMCGLGGDGFALLRKSSGELSAINSGGRAPNKASADTFLELGFKQIPEDGILSVGVPGLVKVWKIMQEKYCSMKLEQILADSIEYAEHGFPVYKNLSNQITASKTKLSQYPMFSEAYLPDNMIPKPGSILTQQNLARTLKSLSSSEGIDSLYNGRIARELAEFSQRNGGWLSLEDLESYDAELLRPISTKYIDSVVYEQPAMSQGFLLLEMLNVLERYDLREKKLEDIIHLMVEAKKFAFRDRLEFFGDTEYTQSYLNKFISKQHAEEIRSQISETHAKEHLDQLQTRGNGETTYFCVSDGDGNCVSFIQSLFTTFGSGIVAGTTGIVLNDRMLSFSLQKDNPNFLIGSKRPVHTLNSYVVCDSDSNPVIIGGTPGADDQVQTNLQIVFDLINLEMSVQEAIEAPRWSSRPGTLPRDEGTPYELHLENRFVEQVSTGLAAKGHRIKLIEPWSIGGAQVIQINPATQVFSAGADPRRDGYAVGY